MGTNDDASGEESNEVWQTNPPDQRRNDGTDAHQEGKNTQGMVHQVAD